MRKNECEIFAIFCCWISDVKFLTSHALKSTSTIRSALKGLLESDLVYQTESGYVIYDRIFNEWLRKR